MSAAPDDRKGEFPVAWISVAMIVSSAIVVVVFEVVGVDVNTSCKPCRPRVDRANPVCSRCPRSLEQIWSEEFFRTKQVTVSSRVAI